MDGVEAEIERAWHGLRRQWPQARRRLVRLRVADSFAEGGAGMLFQDGRRAEICYVLCQAGPPVVALTHTKAAYPAGSFRLPTGGLARGEEVFTGLLREVAEETGLQLSRAAPMRFLGQVDYLFSLPGLPQPLPFSTFVFLVPGPPGFRPVVQDETEDIAGWRWIRPHELQLVAAQLESLGDRVPHWGDWGRFRAPVHEFVYALWDGASP